MAQIDVPVEHFPRWLFASVHKHFLGIDTAVFPLLVQGGPEPGQKTSSFMELRTNGPNTSKKSKTLSDATYQINILIQTTLNDNSIHTPYVDAGKVLSAFTTIPVYKFGDLPEDTGELIGCLTIVREGEESVRVHQFGIIDHTNQLIQATVDAKFEITNVKLK